MRAVPAVSIALSYSIAVRVIAQQPIVDAVPGHTNPAESKSVEPSKLIVYPVRNLQPQFIVEAMKNLFREDPRVKTVKLLKERVLLVRVSGEAREELLEFLNFFRPRAPPSWTCSCYDARSPKFQKVLLNRLL